jgi:hypothetical protein
MTSIAMTCGYAANHQYWQHLCGAEIAVPVGGFALGGIIGINIRRTPNGVGDDYAADAILKQVALHAPFNSRGSRQRYIK